MNEDNNKLHFNKLSANQEYVIKKCLTACIEIFFCDEEYTTLFGITRQEMQEITYQWPNNKLLPSTDLAVNNALVLLLTYPHGHYDDAVWNTYIPASTEEVRTILHTLLGKSIFT